MMKRLLQLYFLILSACTSFFSCAESDFSAGGNMFNPPLKSVLIDTCSVNLSTVLSDTIASSGIQRVFFGQYTSSDMGTTTASAYMSFTYPKMSQQSDFDSDSRVNIVIDSVRLEFIYDNFHYGDTTQVQTIEVSYLTERLDELYRARGTSFYNNNEASSSPSVYSSGRFIRPIRRADNDSTLYVKLPDAFGQEIIDSLRAQSDYMKSEERFNQFFYGFKISPGANDNACLNAFKMTSTVMPVIRIYYHSIDAVPTEQTIDINAVPTYAFSNITRDRSNSLLRNLSSSNETLSSTNTANKAFVQGMGGYTTEITFPSVSSLSELGKNVNVVSALLYVYPVENTYNDFFPLPSNTSLQFLNKLGDVKDIIVSSSSSVTSGILLEDALVAGRFYYVFDITSYITSQIGALPSDWGTLQLSIADASSVSTLGSLVIGDSNLSNSDYRTKLEIQLSILDYE